MTYLEKITYLTGNFIQLCQFSLKNAYRLVCLLKEKEETTVYTDNMMGSYVAAENKAKVALKNVVFKGSDYIISDISSRGIPSKLEKDLIYVLKKRDYVVSSFYIDNADAIATEEIAVYVSKINELDEYCKKATEVNQALAKQVEKLYR